MKKVIFILICIASLSACVLGVKHVQLSGRVVTETRALSGFNAISAAGGIEVRVTRGDAFSVEVMADENLLPYIATEVEGGTLKVRMKSVSIRETEAESVVLVTCPEIVGLSAGASSEIELMGIFEGDHIAISAASAAEISGELRYTTVSVAANSGADVELRGRTEMCSVTASSGAEVDMEHLMASNVTVTASSGAGVSVHASDSITATASSGAGVEYSGNPALVTTNNSSGGEVCRDY